MHVILIEHLSFRPGFRKKQPAYCVFQSQRSKYPETPLNSARRAEIWLPRGCPGGVKNTTHTLAGEAAPVNDHANIRGI